MEDLADLALDFTVTCCNKISKMSADGVNESYRPTVSKQLQNTLTASSLGVGHRYQGKGKCKLPTNFI